MKNIAMLLLMLVMSTMAFAQSKVTGSVKDITGEPLMGATVRVSGAKDVGTVTNIDGNFTLTLPAGKNQLVISYVGYITKTITVSSKGGSVTVILEEDQNLLGEVVAIGYGTMKKSDLSGASVTVGEDALKGSIITSLDQVLQGHASGVSSFQTSGAPGSSSSIRVRGQATINANAEPLYVIDGVVIQGGGNSGDDFGLGDALGNGKVSTISPLSTINPADIVSMEILKDASACAIYGAQGSNGVVLITTKRGKAGEAKFTYDGMTAWSRQSKRLDMMNLREYAKYYTSMADQGIVQQNSSYSDPAVLGHGTDWQDAIFQTAFQHQHQFGAQGGTDKVQYYVSGGYMDQEGTIIGSNFERFNVRTNLDAQLKPWLKLGLSATYSNTTDDLKLADGTEGIIYYSLTTLPDIPIYDIDGNYSSTVREGYTNPNPVALAMYNQSILKRQKLNGNIFADVTPIKHLTWHAELGYDLSWSKADVFKPTVDLGGWVKGSNENRWQKNTNKFWQLKNYVTYDNIFGKHHVTAMVGQECWESTWDFMQIYNNNLPMNDVHNPSLGQGDPTISSGFGSAAMASFFTRENYSYDDRYYVTYTYRYDGSSNFGPRNRWAGFHSFAGSWRFTNEKFMENVKWLNNGKLRFGWGQTGNSNIGGGNWLANISIMPSALGQSYRPANIPNEGIKWESQEQFNVGLDLGFLNDRITLTLDWYRKESKDMLMSLQLPSYMGTSGNGSSALAAPKGNYGSIRNTGFEATLNVVPVRTKDFEWTSNLQVSFNQNKLLALDGTENAALVGYGQWGDVVCQTLVGQSLYGFYGYKVEGVYKDFNDIMNSPVNTLVSESLYTKNDDGSVSWNRDPSLFNRWNTLWPGDLKYKDVNGDGKIDENDKTNIGSPQPKVTFGWNNTFTWKNFDLSIFVAGSIGNKVLNYTSINLSNMKSVWNNQLNSISKHAQIALVDPNGSYDDVTNVYIANPTTKVPRAMINDPANNSRLSDRYVEDGSYLRFKNISLGYTFPKSVINKIGLTNLRIYANVQNLWTITNYSGYDPEVGASTQDSTGMTFGVDNGRYPSPTTCSLGLNLSF